MSASNENKPLPASYNDQIKCGWLVKRGQVCLPFHIFVNHSSIVLRKRPPFCINTIYAIIGEKKLEEEVVHIISIQISVL
mgnify:FL=1